MGNRLFFTALVLPQRKTELREKNIQAARESKNVPYQGGCGDEEVFQARKERTQKVVGTSPPE